MLPFFQDQQERIRKLIFELLDEKKTQYVQIRPWGPDVLDRLRALMREGKMIRGCLVLFAAHMFNKKANKDALRIAAAIELIHAAFLIQDDIMDEDKLRRGKKTLHIQYQDLVTKKGFKNPSKFGEGATICVSDVLMFLSYELLAQIRSPQRVPVQAFLSRELPLVALAQMQDIYLSQSEDSFAEKDILSITKYKSAYYTFSLPLVAGGIFAQQPKKVLTQLEHLGDYMGMIFQIKDDELGLFGTEKELGKPIGSDIKENKKTLFYLHLFKKSSDAQKQKLKQIFGEKEVTDDMLAYVQKTIEETGTRQMIDKKIGAYEQKARNIIDALPVQERYQEDLLKLLQYNLERRK